MYIFAADSMGLSVYLHSYFCGEL